MSTWHLVQYHTQFGLLPACIRSALAALGSGHQPQHAHTRARWCELLRELLRAAYPGAELDSVPHEMLFSYAHSYLATVAASNASLHIMTAAPGTAEVGRAYDRGPATAQPPQQGSQAQGPRAEWGWGKPACCGGEDNAAVPVPPACQMSLVSSLRPAGGCCMQPSAASFRRSGACPAAGSAWRMQPRQQVSSADRIAAVPSIVAPSIMPTAPAMAAAPAPVGGHAAAAVRYEDEEVGVFVHVEPNVS